LGREINLSIARRNDFWRRWQRQIVKL
jgi:hypothetical protein